MFHEMGCHGRIAVGPLGSELAARLARMPGEWLEYDVPSGAIVVRHIQPTSAPSLPTITAELVRMLSEIPLEAHPGIVGGELFIQTEDSPHLVRIRVTSGGGVRLDWAHADFARGRKQPFTDNQQIPVDAVYCRLNGTVAFGATDAARVARELQRTADTYEGLYPEGDFRAQVGEPEQVQVTMRDVNLDVRLLIGRVQELATAGSPRGSVDVTSFDDRHPDDRVRVLFEDGNVWVQEPYYWPDPAPR
jgi:hypothetical protein